MSRSVFLAEYLDEGVTLVGDSSTHVWFWDSPAATLSTSYGLYSWTTTSDLASSATFTTRAALDIQPAVVAPPADSPVEPLRRLSQIFPAPTLNSFGVPVDWQPTSTVSAELGLIQIVIDGIDVTFYNGVPVDIGSWASAEPFDDSTATLTFKGVGPHAALPSWFRNDAPVDINLVKPDGSIQRLWEGLVATDSDSVSTSDYGMTIECQGALFELDHYLSKPALFLRDPIDIGQAIWEKFTHFQSPSLHLADMYQMTTGITTSKFGGYQPCLTSYVADLLSIAQTPDDLGQYTVMKATGRVPVMKLKDATTVHWTIRCAQPGVSHDLKRDFTTAPNVYYGEGIDNDNCHWRNSYFPSLHPDSGAVFPGTIMGPGYSGDDFRLFEQRLSDAGYAFTVDGFFDPSEQDMIAYFQRNAGITVDGLVGPQTWAAAFQPGANEGDLFFNSYIYPLAWDPRAVPNNIGAGGSLLENPSYDFSMARYERYQNFGSRISKAEGVQSSQISQSRFYPADYIGTITLNADPNEGSRLLMKAGQNILFKSHRGTDLLLHIASVSVDFTTQTVTLTVDQALRDMPTLGEVLDRTRNNITTSWRRPQVARESLVIPDQIIEWDCENGSGIIPRQGIYGGLWNVSHFPTAEGGIISRSEFYVDIPARFVVAVFARQINAAELAAIGGTPLDLNFFQQFTPDELVIAWGGNGQACGFYPGLESNGDPLTGAFIENASWYYESKIPPWLFYALWVESPAINYIQGRIFPGTFAQQ